MFSVSDDPAEIAKIRLSNRNVSGKSENLQTNWQNISTTQKTEPELYS